MSNKYFLLKLLVLSQILLIAFGTDERDVSVGQSLNLDSKQLI